MIIGYVGEQGAGKTMWLVKDALRAMEMGLAVAANFPIKDPRTGQEAQVLDLLDGLHPVRDFGQANLEQGSAVFVDEIHQRMPAALWAQTTTIEVINQLSEVRKTRMHLHWSAQWVMLVDRLIRGNTALVYECHATRNPFRADKGGLPNIITGLQARVPLRLRARGYKVRTLEGALSEDAKSEKVMDRRAMWFSPRIASAYDTLRLSEYRTLAPLAATHRPAGPVRGRGGPAGVPASPGGGGDRRPVPGAYRGAVLSDLPLPPGQNDLTSR